MLLETRRIAGGNRGSSLARRGSRDRPHRARADPSRSPVPRRWLDLHRCLEHFGLSIAFASVHSAESEPYGKPHPGVFLTAASSLGIAPKRCLVFEDSAAGVIAARAALMRVVAVPTHEDRDEVEFFLADARPGLARRPFAGLARRTVRLEVLLEPVGLRVGKDASRVLVDLGPAVRAIERQASGCAGPVSRKRIALPSPRARVSTSFINSSPMPSRRRSGRTHRRFTSPKWSDGSAIARSPTPPTS